ncbi:MAG: DUF5320 domain-containing protein [Bacillota bacterium]
MPGLNGSGPMGKGPGTGKGLGRCRVARTDIRRFYPYHQGKMAQRYRRNPNSRRYRYR